ELPDEPSLWEANTWLFVWNESSVQVSSLRSTPGVSGPLGSALVPVLVLLFVLAIDLWVYADAKARWERGLPSSSQRASSKWTRPLRGSSAACSCGSCSSRSTWPGDTRSVSRLLR